MDQRHAASRSRPVATEVSFNQSGSLHTRRQDTYFSRTPATSTTPIASLIGVGIYGLPAAARILRITETRLRRWVGGYTVPRRNSSSPHSRRLHAPARTDLPIIGGGLTLGKHLFSALGGCGNLANFQKWKPDEIDRVTAGPIFARFLDEMEFDDETALARRWWPAGRRTPVVLDPRIGFGAPVVEGTAVRTSVVAGLAESTTVEDAAIAYELDIRRVRAALAFETDLRAA